MIIMEEAAFIDASIWYQVVAPMLEVDGTALICISTPLDEMNFYSQLTQRKDDNGEPIFTVMQVQGACAHCVEHLADPSGCSHQVLERPPWKNRGQQKIVKAFYGKNTSTFARESLGVITQTAGGVFQRGLVERLMNRERVPMARVTGMIVNGMGGGLAPARIYVSIDPCGSGSSHFAIATGVKIDGSLKLVGLDDVHTTTMEECVTVTRTHVRKVLQLLESYRVVATVVLIIENNLAMHAEMLIREVRRDAACTRVAYVQETGTAGKHGVALTHTRKAEYVTTLQDMLRDNAIEIAQPMVSQNQEEALDTLRKQLKTYREVSSEPQQSNPFTATKVTFSGKVDGQNRLMPGQQQDDLVIAVQQLAYWTTRIQRDPGAIQVLG